jgi:hypothetical protein
MIRDGFMVLAPIALTLAAILWFFGRSAVIFAKPAAGTSLRAPAPHGYLVRQGQDSIHESWTQVSVHTCSPWSP